MKEPFHLISPFFFPYSQSIKKKIAEVAGMFEF